MLRIRKISDVMGKQVYTSEGDFFGQVEEVMITSNRIEGWRVKVGSSFMHLLGGAKGVIIPHQFVKAIGDILIVNKGSLPVDDGGDAMEFGAEEASV